MEITLTQKSDVARLALTFRMEELRKALETVYGEIMPEEISDILDNGYALMAGQLFELATSKNNN